MKMAKVRKKQQQKQTNDASTLKDRLQGDLLQQLQEKKTQLKQEEEKKQEEARLKAIEERKQREANKSFEELLNESHLDWETFKDK